MHDEAADAVEHLVRERFDERGPILVRFGQPPKRAIPFRCDVPFARMKIELTAPDGSTHKLEFLGDGQQVIVAGLHGDSGRYYRWQGNTPVGRIKRGELPEISGDEARQLLDDSVALLVRDFGFTIATKGSGGNGAGNCVNGGDGEPTDWTTLTSNIISGADFHDSLTRLAASCIAREFGSKKTVEFLRGLMQCCTGPHDKRWQDRYREIPRAVKSAVRKFDLPALLPTQPQPQQPPPSFPPPPPRPTGTTPGGPTGGSASPQIERVLDVFHKWLLLKDDTPVLAVLGTVAANYLGGDAVWLGVVGPPSNAKTEILASLSKLPQTVTAATLSPAGLLSGTPRRQRAAGTRGGLLNQIGAFGILVLKDFGSILQMRPETKAELLAALREIYDGSWTRVLGSDGGKVLTWQGKIGLLFASTSAIDLHHSVIGSMGDRFLLSRVERLESQFKVAAKHRGSVTVQMRNELAEAVAELFAAPLRHPQETSASEIDRLDATVELVTRLRGSVDRSNYQKEIEMILGAEGGGRLGLSLERLLAGLDAIGVERERALEAVESVALDSVPPNRRQAYEFLRDQHDMTGWLWRKTSDVAVGIGLPTNTTRRVLEDLNAYGLVEKRPAPTQGSAESWRYRP